jgi:uncharacterized OB-fold protein
MTLLQPQTGNIPRPYAGRFSQPYWDACQRGELVFQRCQACNGITHTPAVMCAHCSSRDMVWEQSAGTGTVYSWTSVWRPQTPDFVVPYVPIIVQLDEGWQMLSNLIGCEHDAAEIGMRVQVEFHPITDGVMLPYFRPLA